MEIRGLAFMPLLWVTWSLSGLYALLALTMISGHEKRPYISDTGKAFPESVVYTVVFLVTPIIGVGVAFIQYRFMILRCEPSEKRHIICQRILCVIGLIVCIGTAVNAVFSVKTNPIAHRIGAGLAFFLGAFYNLCQAACLYKRSLSSRRMCHIRLSLALVTIVTLLTFALGMIGGFIPLCPGPCSEIFYMLGMVAEYVGFTGLTMHQVTNYTDFQSLSSSLSREGVSIYLREKTQDPENPE